MNQQITQGLQQLQIQKQRLQHERIELESALEELEGSEDSYKVIGNLMVKKSAKSIGEELSQKLEQTTKQIERLEEQHERLQEQAEQARGPAGDD